MVIPFFHWALHLFSLLYAQFKRRKFKWHHTSDSHWYTHIDNKTILGTITHMALKLHMYIERLQGVWPKIIPVAMEMPIFYVNFSNLNYPKMNDESLEPFG